MSDLINFDSPRPPQETLLIFDTNSPGSLKFPGRPSLTGRESLQILDFANWSDDNFKFPDRPCLNSNKLGDDTFKYPERLSLTGRESLQILDLNKLGDDCFKFPERLSLTGRESLQILDLNNLKLCERPSLSGRESLQILDLNNLGDIGFDLGSTVNARERSNSVAVMEGKVAEEKEESKRKCTSEVVCDKGVSKTRGKIKDEDDDVFIDSICIEANHLASKIGDGSILEESFDGSNILDSTPQPEWDIPDESDTEKPKCNTEEVFKTVDLLLPVINVVDTGSPQKQNEDKNTINILELNQQNLSKLNENNSSEKQNLSNNSSEKRFNVSRTSSTSTGSKSRDAKEIIQSLSQVLSSENVTPEQKTTWQNLLCNLADIVCADDEDTSEQKQSVSSEESSEEISERRKSSCDINPETEEEKPMDLSIKRRALSHSFSFPSQKMPAPSKLSNNLKAQAETLRSYTSGIGRSDTKIGGGMNKLKPRKVEENVKKGPLRAVIPLNVMAKNKEVDVKPKSRLSKIEQTTTPRKNSQETIPKYNKKVTTTPVQESKLKPMAQSTPDEEKKSVANNNNPMRRKFSCPISPLTRNSIKGQRPDLNKSDSLPDVNANGVKRVLNRGKSAGELKPSTSIRPPLKRSFSIGKENHLSSLRKPTERSEPILETDVKDKKKGVIGSTKSLLKPFNLMTKLKQNKK